MQATREPIPGLLGAARGLLAVLVEIGQTRLQLASTELEEERLRVAELLLYAAFALFFLGVGLVFAGLWVVLLFWDTQRVLALGCVTAVFLGFGVCSVVAWRRKARAKRPMLSATIEELRQDQAALRQGAQVH